MNDSEKDKLRCYGIAVLAVLLALLARATLIPVLGGQRFSLTPFLVAIVFCAWYCGVRASILATVLSIVTAWYFFFDPQFSFKLKHPVPEIGELCFFALMAGLVIALGEANRRAHSNLEEGIRERTAELSAANDRLRALTGRLMVLQDEERRRLSRELHDSVGQLLAAISMNVGALSRMQLPQAGVVALSDSRELIQEASREIRTISHLLHPPLLDEMGLVSALKWFVEGFSKRSGIAITLEISDDLGRLEPDVELAVFRVVQECLTNIHRHSGSRDGTVTVVRRPGMLQLTVRDHGTGIKRNSSDGLSEPTGVGRASMAERIAQLSGKLEMHSDGSGTVVTARIPVGSFSQPERQREEQPAQESGFVAPGHNVGIASEP